MLLPDQERVLGINHEQCFVTRNNIAFCLANLGEQQQAVLYSRKLVSTFKDVFGTDHLQYCNYKSNLAFWTSELNQAQAVKEFEELIPIQKHVLGNTNPTYLIHRNYLAYLRGQNGDTELALQQAQLLLPDLINYLGQDHSETLKCRNNIAHWLAQSGNIDQALLKFQSLYADESRLYGPDHPNCLKLRKHIAFWTCQSGAEAEALVLLQTLLPDQERVLGKGHPDCTTTRTNIDYLLQNLGLN